MPFYLRIPEWATRAVVRVNSGSWTAAPAGTMYKVRDWAGRGVAQCRGHPLKLHLSFPFDLLGHKMALGAGKSVVTLALNPSVRLEHWFSEDTVTVHRGALMYSLPIQGNYTVLNTYAFQSRDYQVLPLSEWRFALEVCVC